MKNILKTTLMMLLAGSIITACDKKTEYPEPNTAAVTLPIAQKARVMFVHASPDAPEMNFAINNVIPTSGKLILGQNSAYSEFDIVAPQASTGTPFIAAGTQLRATITPPTNFLFLYNAKRADEKLDTIKSVAFRETSRSVMNNDNHPTLPNTSYSVFLTDTVTRPANIQGGRSTDIGGPLLNYIINDNTYLNFATAAPRTIKLRLVHLSPNAPAVRVTIGSQEATSGTVLSATVVTPFPSVVYRAAATVFTYLVPALADADNKVVLKNIQVRSANTANTLVLTIPSLTVDMGKAYTLVAVGKLGTPSFGVKVIQNN